MLAAEKAGGLALVTENRSVGNWECKMVGHSDILMAHSLAYSSVAYSASKSAALMADC